MMNERLGKQRWEQASTHHLGEGVQQCIDITSMTKLSKQLGKQPGKREGLPRSATHPSRSSNNIREDPYRGKL